LRGQKDITVGRVGELAWAMGRIPSFDLSEVKPAIGSNLPFSTGGINLIVTNPNGNPSQPYQIPANNNSLSVANVLAN
jgi:hypothetical protein